MFKAAEESSRNLDSAKDRIKRPSKARNVKKPKQDHSEKSISVCDQLIDIMQNNQGELVNICSKSPRSHDLSNSKDVVEIDDNQENSNGSDASREMGFHSILYQPKIVNISYQNELDPEIKGHIEGFIIINILKILLNKSM